jgi:hypothetical protein
LCKVIQAVVYPVILAYRLVCLEYTYIQGVKNLMNTVEPGYKRKLSGPSMLNLDIKETGYSGILLYPGSTVPF